MQPRILVTAAIIGAVALTDYYVSHTPFKVPSPKPPHIVGGTSTPSGPGDPGVPPTGGVSGKLTVRGSSIIDPNGNPITLRGYSWGHWGTAQPQDASDQVNQGANMVRLPLRWWGYYQGSGIDSRDDNSPGHIDPAHLAMLDQDIEWASQNHLWIDLFLDSNCGQNGTQDATQVSYCDPNNQYGSKGHNFWTDPAMRQKFIEMWQFVANRYKNTPYMGIYEVLPEPSPVGQTDAQISEFYQQAIGAIHAVDPNTPFMIGAQTAYSIKNASAAYIATTTPIIYTGNLFVYTNGDQQSNINQLSVRLKGLTSFRDTKNVPVFVQQTGVRSGEDPDLTYENAVLSLLNQNNVGWAWWEYRGVGANDYSVYYKSTTDKNGWIEKVPQLNMVSSFLKAR